MPLQCEADCVEPLLASEAVCAAKGKQNNAIIRRARHGFVSTTARHESATCSEAGTESELVCLCVIVVCTHGATRHNLNEQDVKTE